MWCGFGVQAGFLVDGVSARVLYLCLVANVNAYIVVWSVTAVVGMIDCCTMYGGTVPTCFAKEQIGSNMGPVSFLSSPCAYLFHRLPTIPPFSLFAPPCLMKYTHSLCVSPVSLPVSPAQWPRANAADVVPDGMQEDTSLAKVYTLFRSLGLRHLAVIPRASNVVGVITRHDLLNSRMEATCLEQLTLGAGRP